MTPSIETIYRSGILNRLSIGARLRTLRNDRGLTQVQLAHLAGTDQTIISDIERGANMSARTLMGLSRALGVTPTYLMYGGDLDGAELAARIEALSQPDRDAVRRHVHALARN